MKRPGHFRRYLASTVDIVIILFMSYLFTQSPLYDPHDKASTTWPLLLLVVYEPVLNRYAITVGQLLLRFRARTLAGHRRVPLWRGFVRVMSKYLLGIFSFVLMPIQEQRRALHDIVSGTIVLDARRSVTDAAQREPQAT
jgi:uncharacterized RDD family membrane protein YckC